jgi:hypothetical protein
MTMKEASIPMAEVSHRNLRPSLSVARDPPIAMNQLKI